MFSFQSDLDSLRHHDTHFALVQSVDGLCSVRSCYLRSKEYLWIRWAWTYFKTFSLAMPRSENLSWGKFLSLSQLMLARMTQRQERSTHSDRLPQLDRMWVEFAFIFRRFHEGFYPLDNNLSSNCQFDREKVDEKSPQGFAFLHS